MTPRRSAVLTLCVLLAAGGLAACGGGDDDAVGTSTRDTTTTAETPETSGTTGAATPSGTVGPDPAGVSLNVVLLRGDRLGTAHRRVAPTQAVGRAAIEQLLAGPTADEQAAGMTSALPAGTRLDGLDVAGGVATVTLSPAVTAKTAQGQVVYTLTQFPTVEKVRFGPGGTPLGRGDLRDVLPLIFPESVAPGDRVTSPVRVAGLANTFEANVRIRVLGADGSVLADTFTTATSGSGTWGTFTADVAFAKGANSTGKVVVFEDSPKDGSMVNVVEVPVRFA